MEQPRNKKVRFALIGCGVIAQKHVAALRKLPEAEIVGAYDISASAAEAFQAQHHIPTFTHVGEMIEKTNPDVLNILSPSGLHAANVIELIPYGRNFVVEKPLALRLDQVDTILEECDKKNLKVFVVQQNRFNPPIQKLHEAITAGRFGKLVLGSVRVWWCRKQSYYDEKAWRGSWAFDGGVLTNQASHHLDMLIWMMGPVDSVMAKTATRLVNIEAEDTGVVLLKFRSGALGVIEATTATRPKDVEGSISILGERGTVEVGGFFMNELKTWNFAEPTEDDTLVWERHARVPSELAWNHAEFFRDVIQSLNENRKGLVDGLEGRKYVELINAIYESAETGKEVALRFAPKECRLGVAQ